MTAQTENELKIIKTMFKNNNLNIDFISVENTPFLKKIKCNLLYTDLKNINKIKSVIKTLETLLNTSINYYFIENDLFIELKQKNKNTYNFESHFKIDQNMKNKNYIFLGLNAELKPVYKKLNDLKSILIAGSSGSGKSNLLHNIILSYLLLNDFSYLMLIDLKYTELNLYTKEKLKNRLLCETAANFEAAKKTLLIFNNLINDRFKTMQKNKQQTSSEKPILLIIDEYALLFTNNKQKRVINDLICRAAAIGRAANCYLILTTQYPNNQNINNSIRVNLQSKIALHCESINQSYNIIGSTDAIKLNPPGEIITKCDAEEIQTLKTCYISNDYLLNILK